MRRNSKTVETEQLQQSSIPDRVHFNGRSDQAKSFRPITFDHSLSLLTSDATSLSVQIFIE
ncbi:hypothetical protein Syun_004024 [Stephania yunnanensis]|uniref:Uncharacterized protein n=1 Tax=Stephania yunnanensis TaxID=152371 RepID=A0AAP0L284_9MAGN